MSKKIVLVGHCGADTAYLKMAVKQAEPAATITTVDSDVELKNALVDGADLVLINRLVDWGFESNEGVEIVRHFAKAFPKAKMMLVSNHESAHAAAVQAGGLHGFGKREIGSPKVKQVIQRALGTGVTV